MGFDTSCPNTADGMIIEGSEQSILSGILSRVSSSQSADLLKDRSITTYNSIHKLKTYYFTLVISHLAYILYCNTLLYHNIHYNKL